MVHSPYKNLDLMGKRHMSIAYLRHVTRQDHQRLEDRLDIRNRCATLFSYRQLLERFYGFYRPYETVLKRSCSVLPSSVDLDARTRLPQLTSDLQALAISGRTLQEIPECLDIPHPGTRAEALGCLYVTEGSTLGGQIIRRIVQEKHGNDVPTTFFHGYGAQTGSRWRELCTTIDGIDFTEGEKGLMAQAACGVFCSLETWLCDGTSHKAS